MRSRDKFILYLLGFLCIKLLLMGFFSSPAKHTNEAHTNLGLTLIHPT